MYVVSANDGPEAMAQARFEFARGLPEYEKDIKGITAELTYDTVFKMGERRA
jgi:hypothetical protein